jgi:hypothetical protein
MSNRILNLLFVGAALILLSSCKSGPINLFKTASPHELYLRKLNAAGLSQTSMGRAWMDTSNQVLNNAVNITVPYKETGYFAAERVPAASYKFNVKQGQKISIQLTKVPDKEFMIYMDVWAVLEGQQSKLIASADTLGQTLNIDVDETGAYLLRLQPELLRSGSYTLQITNGPSLSFPVKTARKPRIESFFGAGRDANSRKHEGVDIFEAFHTPVIASANGTVTRVNENKLGGLVVMMRPEGKDYTLYYAHLDKQLATEGQQVVAGDTLGLMGKTGNAITTAPHLHFGIYTGNGAVDPLPFINPQIRTARPISASTENLNATLRSKGKTTLFQSDDAGSKALLSLPAASVMHIEAAAADWYKASLPDGRIGFVQSKSLIPIKTALRKLQLSADQLSMYDQPLASAAVKKNLAAGSNVDVLGSFNTYYLVQDQHNEIGWVKEN